MYMHGLMFESWHGHLHIMVDMHAGTLTHTYYVGAEKYDLLQENAQQGMIPLAIFKESKSILPSHRLGKRKCQL